MKFSHIILFFIILFTFFLSVFIIPPVLNAADECTTLEVTPGTGSTATEFLIKATGCTPGNSYLIQIYDEDSNLVSGHNVASDAQGIINYKISALSAPGTYIVYLIYQGSFVQESEFTVSELATITCGSIVQPNTRTCDPGELSIDCCPKACASIPCQNAANIECPPNSWVCGDYGDTTHFNVAENVQCLSSGLTGINTAIGCIVFTDFTPFTIFAFTWGGAIAGGIALLLIAYASFLYITSQGDPKKVQASRESLTSAIAGLLFLIFSIFLLEFIGVDVLNLPGF